MIPTYKIFEITQQQLKSRMAFNTVKTKPKNIFSNIRAKTNSLVGKVPGLKSIHAKDQLNRKIQKLSNKEKIKNLAGKIKQDRANVTGKYANQKGVFGFIKKFRHNRALKRIDKNYNKLQKTRDKLATVNRMDGGRNIRNTSSKQSTPQNPNPSKRNVFSFMSKSKKENQYEKNYNKLRKTRDKLASINLPPNKTRKEEPSINLGNKLGRVRF